MERAEWMGTDDDTPLVGIVGPTENLDSAAIDRTVTDHDATVVVGSLEEIIEQSPSVLVCVGQSALGAVARANANVPVLPVDAGNGVRSVSTSQLPTVIDAVLAGAGTERQQSTLRVETERETVAGGSRGPHRAFFDVALVTEEPARISEYSVTSRGDRLAQFRADGVVVATPQGSHGYASAAGGPLLSNGLDAVAVVPVAPFVTQTRQWIVPNDGLELAVKRDEGPVTLQVDDRSLGTVAADSPVSISPADPLSILVPDDEFPETG